MKRLALQICLVVVALVGNVGESSANDAEREGLLNAICAATADPDVCLVGAADALKPKAAINLVGKHAEWSVLSSENLKECWSASTPVSSVHKKWKIR